MLSLGCKNRGFDTEGLFGSEDFDMRLNDIMDFLVAAFISAEGKFYVTESSVCTNTCRTLDTCTEEGRAVANGIRVLLISLTCVLFVRSKS